jgi:hypothetical protein
MLAVMRTVSVIAIGVLASCAPRQSEVGGGVEAPNQVTAQLVHDEAAVSWHHSSATQFRLRRSPDGATFDVTGNHASVPLPVALVRYWFTVEAAGPGGFSAPSAVSNSIERIPQVAQAALPAAPTSVTVSAFAAPPRVQWQSVSADSFVIVSDPATQQVLMPGGASSTALAGLHNGVTYRVGVSAVSGSQRSTIVWSQPFVPAVVPDAPGAVYAVARLGAATVGWEAPANTGGTAISAWEISSTTGAMLAVVPSASARSVDIDGLSVDNPIAFVVRARSLAGLSLPSASSNTVVPSSAPASPEFVTASKISRGVANVEWTWNSPAFAGTFVITTEPAGHLETVSSTARSVTLSRLPTDVPVRFRVTAVATAGDGAPSTASNLVLLGDVPTAVRDVQVFAATDSAYVTWSAPSDNGGAAVSQYRVTAGGVPVAVSVSGAQTAVRVSGLQTGQRYTFHVTATNLVGDSPDATSGLSEQLHCAAGFPNPGMAELPDPWWYTTDLTLVDMNGDGTKDIVTASVTGFTITSLTNKGSVARIERIDLQSQSGQMLGVGDFDGDGAQEVVVGALNATFIVDRTRTPRVIAEPVSQLAVADIDGDGDPDVVLKEDPLVILVNDGSGYFSRRVLSNIPPPAVTCTFCVNSIFMAVGDVDGDGRADIAIDSDVGLTLLTHLEQPIPSRVDIPSAWGAVAIADFDGDGRADIAAQVQHSGPSGTINDQGTGVWETSRGPIGPRAPDIVVDAHLGYGVRAVDLDGDGIFELTDFKYFGADGTVVRRDASGNFQVDSRTSVGLGPLAAADLDGDGLQDVVAVVAGGNDNTRLAVMLGRNGDPMARLPSAASDLAQVAFAADFNHDGHADVIAGSYPQLFMSSPAGFSAGVALPTPGGIWEINRAGIGDFNGDGWTDFAATGEVFLNRNGQLVGQGLPSRPTAVVGDFNGDGFDDVAATPDMYWGSATGPQVQAALLPAGNTPWRAAPFIPGAAASLWLDYGARLWSLGGVVTDWTPFYPPLFVGDLDGDGRRDIFGSDSTNGYATFSQASDGTYGAPMQVVNESGGLALMMHDFQFGDFDGDGDLDFASVAGGNACWGQEVTVHWNDGTGNFAHHAAFQTVGGSTYLATFDDNHDGRPDLIVGNGGLPTVMLATCAE